MLDTNHDTNHETLHLKVMDATDEGKMPTNGSPGRTNSCSSPAPPAVSGDRGAGRVRG